MVKPVFPIKTKTSCQLKWNWSTLYLNSGITRSCHRTSESQLTSENFNDFHNTPIKISDRQRMIQGKWPLSSCGYCKGIEDIGGVSDRIRQLTIPYDVPKELLNDNSSVFVTPTVLEVYFNNTCNLGCLYCHPTLSSSIESENKRFGSFKYKDIELKSEENHYKNLVPSFWNWFSTGFSDVRNLNILGGEPFYQKELYDLYDAIENAPNSECTLTIVTNLMVNKSILQRHIERLKSMLISKKLKRVDITCSIDCWGEQQEYVRWGIDLDQWEDNFRFLMSHKWLYLNINQTIMSLTIKSMPELLVKLSEWRKERKIGHWFSGAEPSYSWMKTEIFHGEEFKEDAKLIMNLMPQYTDEDKVAYQYMQGILNKFLSVGETDIKAATDFFVYLNEKDRRRNTNWRKTFPWLEKYEGLCGITK